jgi:DNA topoisomerase II
VAQLAGYIGEHAQYHHGEQSMQSTIIALAQTFVGANNINLMSPNGQFGTRAMGGQNAASPRYIFTQLAPLARRIFPALDDPILKYLDEDGKKIEPEWYMPVIPMVLVNGADGIGTGIP